MNVRLFLFASSTLLSTAVSMAQVPETALPDSLGRVEKLKEATVLSRRELITTDADKLSYNVEADPMAEGGNLIDIIRNIPMLSVNGDDEVLMNGSKDYKVLVNGRSTGLLARNFNQLIKTIPATSIKEIQVITNPPVKYDAEGIGGVINIILSKRLKSGYNGSVNANAGTLGSVSGSGYISANMGKFAVSANASGTYFPNPRVYGRTDIETFVSEDNHYQALDFSEATKYSIGSFSLESSYEPDSLNLITLSGWANAQKAVSDFEITESFWNTTCEKTVEMLEPTDRLNRYNTFASELAYQKTFRNDGGVLTFSYSIDGNPNSTENNVKAVPVLNFSDYHRHSFNTEHTIEQTGQADYFAAIRKKHQIEAGGKYTFRSHVADSKDELWDFSNDAWVVDNSNVNDLDYRQHIFAAYASYGYKFADLTLKGGARLEYTLNRGVSKSISENLTFDNSNFNIVPYVNAAWQVDDRNSISLSYTRRLGRPSVSYLNPYVFEESPYSRMHGNPDLRTVVSDAVTLTCRTSGEKWNLTARMYGSLCSNKIEYLSSVTPDGVKVSTYENAVKDNYFDALVDFSWNPSENVGFQMSAKGGYRHMKAPLQALENDGANWSVDISGNAALWKGAMASASADASGGEITLQRTYRGVEYLYSLGLRQGFIQNRLVVTAAAIMPFQNRYVSRHDTYTSTFEQHNHGWYCPRQMRLALTWRFGKTTINVRHTKKTEVSDKL